MRGLEGKRIIVAGSATGIGAASARRLHAEGAKVFLGDINTEGVKAMADELSAPWRTFDLTDDGSVAEMVEAARSELGGLDGLANIAADVSPNTYLVDKNVVEMDVSIWQHALNTNLIGFARVCQQAVPLLLEAGGGAIVNLSSAAAISGGPEQVAYASSKAGVEALTRHVARRWGKENVRCNAVAPGVVLTEAAKKVVDEEALLAVHMLPRLGHPDEVAAAIAFLLSEDGAWITGQVIGIDGGLAPRR